MPFLKKPVIALVGRPNVGKSTLFNRLAIRKKAIVHEAPGITRDRKYSDAKIGSFEFTVIDTPGLEESEPGTLEYNMMQQTIHAIKEADLTCLVVDARDGIIPIDKFFANLIRKYTNNYIMIVNKAEKILTLGSDYYKIGFKDPVSISAEHGTGMADLYDTIALALSKIETKNDKGRQSNTKYPNLQLLNQSEEYNNLVNTALGNIEIVIAGRPNTGKSTFINSLLNEQRVLTGDMPGITRESIEIPLFYNKYLIKLIDTAGLRRKHNIKQRIEKLSSSDTIESIKFANTVILMLDATIALEQQDLNIANYVLEQGRSLIIVVNKWDLVLNKENFKSEIYYKLEHSLPQAKDISVVFISALNRENINSVLDSAIKTYTIWNSKISTSKLNNWINFAIERHPLSLQHNGRRVRIKYITQIKTRPPTFKLFTNYPEAMTDSYIKYLTNSMRDVFSLPGVPIRFYFSKSDNPYNKNKLSDKIKKSQ